MRVTDNGRTANGISPHHELKGIMENLLCYKKNIFILISNRKILSPIIFY